MTLTGTEVLNLILGKTGTSRETVLLDLLLTQGAIPSFFHTFVPVQARGKVPNGETVTIEYLVSPDYLCLGTNTDFLRVPLFPTTAQKVADHLGCLLPTKRMVDQIYEAATIKLYPCTYQPKIGGPSRESSQTYGLINTRIQGQLAKVSKPYLGLLIAGQKKDVVISSQLPKNPRKVAIYGWHEKIGKPIQPLFLGHAENYVDYSHGIRMVSKKCKVNGIEMDLEAVLKSSSYASILTGDGPLPMTRYTTS